MTLNDLPLELRQQIAAYVETFYPPSLYAFNLTNKACHEASMFHIYREIHITVRNREELRRDVDRLMKALCRADFLRRVQCIVIKGTLNLGTRKPENDSKKRMPPYWIDYGLQEVLDHEEPIFYADRHVVYDQPVIQRFSEEDMAWTPVIEFVRALPHLKDLIYDCYSQFPPSLLDVLHAQHTQCRLHHLTFRFRTLLWGVPKPYEMELATSPSLHRVKVACGWRDTDGDDDFNQEALMDLVSGLAPNLKDVTVLRLLPMLSMRYVRARDDWKGLPGYSSKPVGSLTSLSLKGYSDLSTKLLESWADYTDFSCLQQLTLGGAHDLRSTGLNGETMQWLSHIDFSQLRRLHVHLHRDDMFDKKPHYTDHAVSFFQGLNPLEELSVTGPIDARIVNAIVSQHGQTLRKLRLRPIEQTFRGILNANVDREIPMEFSKDHILHIQTGCPALEELAIPVKRNKSSAAERAIYECFAKMENLKSLFLTLDCSNWRVTHDRTYNPQFDEEDAKPVFEHSAHITRGIIKETFINCAVDEGLARSIWEAVSKKKSGKRLQRLKLWTTGGDDFGRGDSSVWVTDVLSNLSRSWLIERVPRDDCQDITVRELGQREREARDAKTTTRRTWHSDLEPEKAFGQVWPPKKSSESWQGDWSSFPLQA